MTPFEQFLENLFNFNIWVFTKIMILIFLVVYMAFAVVIVRQVKLMTGVLNGNLNLPLQAIALANLALAILIFLIALVVL